MDNWTLNAAEIVKTNNGKSAAAGEELGKIVGIKTKCNKQQA